MLSNPEEQLEFLLKQQSTTQKHNLGPIRVTNRDGGANQAQAEFTKIMGQSLDLELVCVRSNNVAELFDQKSLDLQLSFRDNCLNYLLKPHAIFKLNQICKIEEVLWRRCYHNLYRFYKSKRDLMKRQDEQLFSIHFHSGMGFYSNFILQLRIRFNLGNKLRLPEPLNFSLNAIDDFCRSNQQNNEIDDVRASSAQLINTSEVDSQRDWAYQAIYRSLVYMGDLARYLPDFYTISDCKKLSYHYYISACKYLPDNGLPFNQLATMAGNSNYNLDGIANYMRSCLKKEPFVGAQANIQSLFDQNMINYRQMFQEDFVKTSSQVLSSQDPRSAAESLIKNVITTFILLTSDLYSATSNGQKSIIKSNEKLTLFFEMLREALDIDPIEPIVKESDYDKRPPFTPISYGNLLDIQPRYIDSTIMYEFCNIVLMLQTTCYRWRKTSFIQKLGIGESVINSVNTLSLNLLYYSASKCQKMILSKIQALKIGAAERDLSEPPNKPKSYYSECLEELYTQTYLPTIKVFCDWLLAQSDIITSNLQSFRAFSSDLSELVSMIAELLKLSTDMETPRKHDSDCYLNGSSLDSKQEAELTIGNVNIFNHIYDGSDWKQTYPLSCDLPLVGLEAIKSVHESNIDFDYEEDLNLAESGFVAYQCLEAFNESLKLVLIKAG